MNIDKFIEVICKSVRGSETEKTIDNILSKRKNVESKLERLVDLVAAGDIDRDTFQGQKLKYQKEIEVYDKKIEQHSLIKEDDAKVEEGIKRFKVLVQKHKGIQEYDDNLFEALVDYAIIGGYDESGEKDTTIIRFICKKGFNFTPREDLTKELIVSNNNIGDSESCDYSIILDFISNQAFYIFDFDDCGRRNKRIINGVRVRLEVEC